MMLDRLFSIIVAAVAIFLNIIFFCSAHEQNEPFAEWMMSLHQPDNPVASCCGPADQYYAISYAESAEGFDVIIFNRQSQFQTISVSEDKVIWDKVNPTSRGVLFMSTEGSVYCFVPGSGV